MNISCVCVCVEGEVSNFIEIFAEVSTLTRSVKVVNLLNFIVSSHIHSAASFAINGHS